MNDDRDVDDIARRMIRSFGSESVRITRKRAENHRRHGELEGASFWQRVADTAERVLSGRGTIHPELAEHQ